MNFLTRLKFALILSLLMLLEIGPFPVTAFIGLFIVFFRPRWFKEAIDRIYDSNGKR